MTSSIDTILRGGTVVTATGVSVADVAIAGGRIVRLAPDIAERAAEEIDARGLHVFPGILDAHVHFNEPGRADWEGLGTGSAALAAGGGTAFFDMPLNSTPPVLDAATFAAKRSLAEQKSVVDFALWGGLTPGNLDHLRELRDAGAIGLKAFMCGSGIDDFPGVTSAATLREGMKRAAALGLLVAVHAEDDALAQQLTDAARARGETDPRSWLATRPIAVELAAIRTALELAGETRCALHVVHVSSPEGLALIAEGKARGVNVTAETCPHYLLLNEDDVVRLGAPAKCAPPLRAETTRCELWECVDSAEVATIGSDHSPAPPAMKTSRDFFAIWGGISGCQHAFPLLLSEALERAATAATSSEGSAQNGEAVGSAFRAAVLTRFAKLLAANIADRFRLGPAKGRIREGADADLALLDLRREHTLHNADLLYHHNQGPYDGRRCTVRVVRTLVRGRSIWRDAQIAPDAPRGQFLRPIH